MLNIDKDATIAIAGDAKEVFLRFGSTRGLSLVMVLSFLAICASISPMDSVTIASLGFAAFALTLLSFHRKPHIDRMPQ